MLTVDDEYRGADQYDCEPENPTTDERVRWGFNNPEPSLR